MTGPLHQVARIWSVQRSDTQGYWQWAHDRHRQARDQVVASGQRQGHLVAVIAGRWWRCRTWGSRAVVPHRLAAWCQSLRHGVDRDADAEPGIRSMGRDRHLDQQGQGHGEHGGKASQPAAVVGQPG